MTNYTYIKVKTALSPSKLPDIRYALNPYVGCAHGCIYCYAADLCKRYFGVSYNWGSEVIIKKNIIEVLKKDVKRLSPGIVGVSTITDPYQPIEETQQLTREAMRILSQNRFKVSIQTKSTLLLRDLDLINSKNFDVGFTITTLNDAIAKYIEPNAPSPNLRAKAADEVSKHGIETWIFLGPIIPLVNDHEDQIEEVVEFASSINSYIIYDKLNIKPVMNYNMRMKWNLNIDLEEVINQSMDSSYFKRISKLLTDLCKKHKVKCVPAFNTT
ncbi:MAG: radical SAM protein [Sulfolobales archaeon]|nr:radical SAM protein [Sulfolobales archaeon]MCX8185883.1 radical SAM protein [Sulfolobales archaeon]MDW7969140.1 radical SAM protein [Sulfolobales archaeon]